MERICETGTFWAWRERIADDGSGEETEKDDVVEQLRMTLVNCATRSLRITENFSRRQCMFRTSQQKFHAFFA